MFVSCDEESKGTLNNKGIQKLNALLFKKYPRFGSTDNGNSYDRNVKIHFFMYYHRVL